jgi:hypothetical protein
LRLDPAKLSVTRSPHLRDFEFPTLRALKADCDAATEDLNILYLHSKGASKDTRAAEDWRRLMLHFTVERYPEALKQLESHAACGVNIRKEPALHFSGNFWWARSSYIKQLKTIESLDQADRYQAEFWIGDEGRGDLASLHDSGKDHWEQRYPRSAYCGAGPARFEPGLPKPVAFPGPGNAAVRLARRLRVSALSLKMALRRH